LADILIVEPDKNQRLLLEEELACEGHRVRSAASGRDALAAASKALPGLVVLDLHMKGMDGFELLGRLLAISIRLPVVIYTAYTGYRDNYMASAADAYLIKQSDLTELKDTIARLLGEPAPPLPQPAAASPLSWSPGRGMV